MLENRLICAFLVVLILQCIDGVPAPAAQDLDPAPNQIEYNTSESNIQDNVELPGCKQLAHLASSNFSTLFDFELRRTYEIAKEVLADPAISSVNTVEMISERDFLENYVKSVRKEGEAQMPSNKSDPNTRFFFIIDKGAVLKRFTRFVFTRNVSTVTDRNDAQKVIWHALLRHGLENYEMDASSRWESFVSQFADDVLRYVSSLRPAERQQEENLVEFCEKYEQETNEMTKAQFGNKLANLFIEPFWGRKRRRLH